MEAPRPTKKQTVADYCTRNSWFKSVRLPKAQTIRAMVEQKLIAPEGNPYEGWIGQGSLQDFNNENNDDIYWKRARAYFWLQEEGSVEEIYVKILSPFVERGLITVIFHADAIKVYFDANPGMLPAVVPRYHR